MKKKNFIVNSNYKYMSYDDTICMCKSINHIKNSTRDIINKYNNLELISKNKNSRYFKIYKDINKNIDNFNKDINDLKNQNQHIKNLIEKTISIKYEYDIDIKYCSNIINIFYNK